jgi:hypothetical protein
MPAPMLITINKKKGLLSPLITMTVSVTEALFRYKNFLDFDTVTLSFLFDKYCPII